MQYTTTFTTAFTTAASFAEAIPSYAERAIVFAIAGGIETIKLGKAARQSKAWAIFSTVATLLFMGLVVIASAVAAKTMALAKRAWAVASPIVAQQWAVQVEDWKAFNAAVKGGSDPRVAVRQGDLIW